MKRRIFFTLSKDLLGKLDRRVRAQVRRTAREAAAIDRHVAKLNAEMRDALSFQAGFCEE